MSLSTSSSRSSASLLIPSVSSRPFPISGCLLCERQLTEALQNGQSLTLEKKQWNHYEKFICICLLIIHYISAGTCFSLLDKRVWLSLEGLTKWEWASQVSWRSAWQVLLGSCFFSLKHACLNQKAGWLAHMHRFFESWSRQEGQPSSQKKKRRHEPASLTSYI